jgi:hypothetical protein
MAKDDMNHMRHIDTIAAVDCDVLREKEATYKGSWKAAGGRSAWFMARRNMDRLINMLAPPENAEFAVSEFDRLRLSMEQNGHAVIHDTDMKGSINIVMDMLRSEDIFAKIAEKPDGEDGSVLACMRDLRRYFLLIEGEMVARGAIKQKFEKPRTPVQAGVRTISPYPEIKTTPNPGNGSQHASLVPWQIGPEYHNTLVDRVGTEAVEAFYKMRSAHVWRLEPIVEGVHKLPRELVNVYEFTVPSPGERACWVLKREMVPPDLEDDFMRLQREMNTVEYEQSLPEFRFMYENVQNKWILRDKFGEWSRVT